MAKSIIFVHGRAQQGRRPEEIKNEWCESLAFALGDHASRLISEVEIHLPFYGDDLEDFNRQFDDEIPADIIMRGDLGETDPDYLEFAAGLFGGLQERLNISDSQLKSQSNNASVERGPLNWDWIHDLLKAADSIPGISAHALEHFTRDVYLYLTRSKVRNHINAIVEAALKVGPSVVVGHSLGSVVAYDVLRGCRRAHKVSDYISVGSPLGVGPIMRVLRPIVYPPQLRSWYNAYDHRDVVALNPLTADFFPIASGSIKNYGSVANRTENAHGISGYLSDPNVAAAIYAAVFN